MLAKRRLCFDSLPNKVSPKDFEKLLNEQSPHHTSIKDLNSRVDNNISLNFAKENASEAQEVWPSSLINVYSAAILTFIFALSCYLNALMADFVFDDEAAILGNPDIVSKEAVPFMNFFTHDFWGEPIGSAFSHQSYRPFTALTFRLDYLLSGKSRVQFHGTNIILHGITSSIFVFVARNIFSGAVFPSLLAGLLFASHPIHTEAVTGLVGRADILSTLFQFLAMLTYVKSCELCDVENRTVSGVCFLFLFTFPLAVFAMLAKEPGIAVLGVCIAYDFIGRQRIEKKHFLPPLLVVFRLLCTFAFAMTAVFIRLKSGAFIPEFSEPDNPGAYNSNLFTRILTLNYYAGFSAFQLLLPTALCCDWAMGSIEVLESVSDHRNIVTVCSYSSLIFLVYWGISNKRKKIDTAKYVLAQAAIASAVLLIVPFIPGSNLFVRVGYVAAERVLYMPSSGFCVLVVLILRFIFGSKKVMLLLSTFFLCTFYCYLTIQRNGDWQHEELLWRSAIRVNPVNSKMQGNLGSILYRTNRIKEAETHLRLAVNAKWEAEKFINNPKKRRELQKEGIVYLRKAVEAEPLHSTGVTNLGIALHRVGRVNEAEELFLQAMSFRHADASAVQPAHESLCLIYNERMLQEENSKVRKKKAKHTAACFQRYLLVNPHHKWTKLRLVEILANELDQNEEAVLEMEKLLQLNPSSGSFHTHISILKSRIGLEEEAIWHNERASDLSPRNFKARYMLGTNRISQNRLEEAIFEYEAAIALKPNDITSSNNLAYALIQLANKESPTIDRYETLLERARKFVEKVLSIDPKYEKGLANLSDLEILESRKNL
eukprot:g5041.t1